MRAALVAVALLATALCAAPAAGAEPGSSAPVSVAMGFDAFTPPQVDVLAGDVVRWSNVSVRQHTVTAVDGSWDSGRLARDAVYARRFETAGVVPYICLLHVFMRGEVDVHDLLLDAPAQAAAPGHGFPVTGRAALASGSAVAIEADSGAGFAVVARTTVQDDGTFRATVVPSATASIRAVAETGAVGPPVRLVVVDQRVTARASGRRDGRTLVQAEVAPGAAGATVVLQLRLRERFGWWPVARARLDAASRARFVVRRRPRAPARVLLTLPDGATELATSATFPVGRRGAGAGATPVGAHEHAAHHR